MTDSDTSSWSRRLTGYALNVGLLAAVFVAVTAFQTRNMLTTDRQPAPELVAPLLHGGDFSLADTGDQPVLVYFFAPWCRICGASADNVERLRRLIGDELDVVTVALDWRDVEEVREYADRHGLGDPVLLGSAAVARAWQVYAYPTYYVLDSNGRVAKRDVGYSTQLGLLWRAWVVD